MSVEQKSNANNYGHQLWELALRDFRRKPYLYNKNIP